MWTRREKLWLSTFALLRAESRRRPPLPCGLRSVLRSSRVLSPSFFPPVAAHGGRLLPGSRVSGRFLFSSEPGDRVSPRCWSCGSAAASAGPFLTCASCGCVQPVDPSVDFFQIFGLEKAYDIKVDNLDGKYKDWQKKIHPDLVHSKSEIEKNCAAEQSARVIEAYHTLSRPLSRALYLLKLEGIEVDEEQTVTDPDLLAEMMDIREAVEEATGSQALRQIQTQIQKKIDAWSNSFHEAFKKKNIDDAVASIQRMRYYDKANEEIVKKL